MALRLFRTFLFAMLAIALLWPGPSRADNQDKLRPTIAFLSTRDDPDNPMTAEIYLISPDDDIPCDIDSCDPRRLTDNDDGDIFAKLSPDGKKIVFDSNRRRTSGEPINTSDLFLMKADGKEQTFLTRGSNASWSPDGRQVVFHASASGTGRPFRTDPGSATEDSDIFVINVGDCLEHHDACQEENGPIKRNLTNTTSEVEPYAVEDDADWSPAGQQIVFTSHLSDDNDNDSRTAEIYVMNADGSDRTQLTENDEEERAPAWSPDGSRILFMCRPEQLGGAGPFEICIMNADGTGRTQLTHDSIPGTNPPIRFFHATPVWSPDGTMIVFDKTLPGVQGSREMWTMEPAVDAHQTLLTDTPGINGYSNYGVVKTTGHDEDQVAADSQDRAADHGKQHTDKGKGKKDPKHKQRHGGGKRHR